jgi:BMFP domain-containing protein YqiC
MQSNNRLFEDAAKLAGGALGALSGVRREIETLVQQQFERLQARMDLVTRDEFEAVKAMAAVAREENEKLSARLDALESTSRDEKPKAKPRARGKSTGPSSPD